MDLLVSIFAPGQRRVLFTILEVKGENYCLQYIFVHLKYAIFQANLDTLAYHYLNIFRCREPVVAGCKIATKLLFMRRVIYFKNVPNFPFYIKCCIFP